MNKKLMLQFLITAASIHAMIQAIPGRPPFQNPTPNNPNPSSPMPGDPILANPITPAQPQIVPAPITPIFPSSTTPPLASNPTQTNPNIPVVQATPGITPTAPQPSKASKPKTPTQAQAEIKNQIKKGIAPAKINNYGAPQATMYNNAQAPLFVGFEGSIALSSIPQGGNLLVPVGQNYIIYSTNNPSGSALHISYQNDITKPNKTRKCKTNNGYPLFESNESESFTGNAYITLDANKNVMLSTSN